VSWCGIDRDAGRFLVTDFSHHDDVWILSENGAKTVCECEPIVRVYLDLIDARQGILDWIFDGDYGNVGSI
jgi:hypothetical protein